MRDNTLTKKDRATLAIQRSLDTAGLMRVEEFVSLAQVNSILSDEGYNRAEDLSNLIWAMREARSCGDYRAVATLHRRIEDMIHRILPVVTQTFTQTSTQGKTFAESQSIQSSEPESPVRERSRGIYDSGADATFTAAAPTTPALPPGANPRSRGHKRPVVPTGRPSSSFYETGIHSPITHPRSIFPGVPHAPTRVTSDPPPDPSP